MALYILRDITADISGKWFTLMVDETRHLANTEQNLMVVCLRYVDDNRKVYEEPVGLYSLESTSTETIVSTIKYVLLRMNLRIDVPWPMLQWGQQHVWVKLWCCNQNSFTRMQSSLYTHCYGHALSLAAQDALRC